MRPHMRQIHNTSFNT